MTQKQIEGTDVILFIRLLGELCACGLSDKQYVFLKNSADMDYDSVNEVLKRADASYEIIKDLAAAGYQMENRAATREELKEIAVTEDRIVKRIVFPSDSDLEICDYTEDKNDLVETCLTDDIVTLGEVYGLEYECLFSTIPLIASGDIPSDQIEELLDPEATA